MGLEALEGSGDALEIHLKGYRTTKAGTYEEYDVIAKVCRHSVMQLLEQVKAMHERDRARLASETKRIERELGVLRG